MTTAADTLTRSMTEDDLLIAIVEAAQYRGWLVHHIRRSDKALQMGYPGFPDLVLARDSRVLFLELKSEKGRVTAFQHDWQKAIGNYSDNGAHVIWPEDLDVVLGWLE